MHTRGNTFKSELRGKTLRDGSEIHLPKTKSAMGQSTFKYAAGKEWNNPAKELHVTDLSLNTFETKFRIFTRFR